MLTSLYVSLAQLVRSDPLVQQVFKISFSQLYLEAILTDFYVFQVQLVQSALSVQQVYKISSLTLSSDCADVSYVSLALLEQLVLLALQVYKMSPLA